jgi:PAS domain S-box-containing protein
LYNAGVAARGHLLRRVVRGAALRTCGFPLAIIDAAAPGRPVVYANPAFEKFFGLRPGESTGLPLALVIFRGDEARLYRLLAQGAAQRELDTWTKDGSVRHLEMTLGALRIPKDG